MKLKTALIGALIFFSAQAAAFATTITVSGRQLLVNCAPFLMRGMNYKPTSNTGTYDWGDDWTVYPSVAMADMDKMAQMGVNTIRVYVLYERLFNDWSVLPTLNNPAGDTVDPTALANYTTCLNYAATKGIYVIMDYFLPYNQDYVGNTTLRGYEELRFQKIINVFKNSTTFPNVLMWAFGNENNFSFNVTPMTDTQMFQLYEETIANAKSLCDTTHPYTAPIGYNGDITNFALTNLVPDMDVWSENFYQFGPGYTTAINGYPLTKPWFFSEFGNDAYDNTNGVEDQADEAAFYQDRWANYIGPNLSALNASNKLLGGCAFEWNDEWWKCGNNTVHDTCGFAGNNSPDNYSNEEWYGIADALPDASVGPRVYRSAAATIQNLWTNPPYNTTVPNTCGTSPTPTPTFTPTKTSTPNPCQFVFSDFSTALCDNAWNGAWGWAQQVGSGNLNCAAPGYMDYGMDWTFSTASGWAVAYSALNPGADPAGNAGSGLNARDISSYGRVSFWVKSSVARSYWFKVASDLNMGPGSAWWEAPFNATPAWTQVSLNFDTATFQNPGGNTGTLLQNLQNATQFVFDNQSSGGTTTTLSLDDVYLMPVTCVPTNTPTPTNTPGSLTPTPTITNTPNPCQFVFADFTSGTCNNAWNGGWGWAQQVGTGNLNCAAPGYVGNGMDWTFSTASGWAVAYAALNPGANPTGAGTSSRDISSYGQVTFWVKSSTARAYWFKLASNTNMGPNSAWWEAPFNATTAWSGVTLNFNAATFQNPGTNTGTLLQNLQNATQFVFDNQSTGGTTTDLFIDEMVLVPSSCVPTYTPTPTITATTTNTSTNSPTKTATTSPTNSPSNTPTRTETNSPTQTPTLTVTKTPTPTSTNSPTNTLVITSTFTNSPTNSPTKTPSVTPTNSPTVTLTNSPTLTATLTATRTSTPTPTDSATNTPAITNTATNSPSNTPTATASSTATNSLTRTPTNTATMTATNTLTLTASSTATRTPANTLSPTATSSATPSPTLSPTNTASFTPTSTATFSPTRTSTSTSTSTTTNSPTRTATNTPTLTPTATNSNTGTWTPTGTLISTSTFTQTPTNTPTSTPTNTLTATPSNTPSSTPTKTSTNTPTLTPTLTPTSTLTSTITSTVTKTATNSPTQTPTQTITNTPTNTLTATPSSTPSGTATNSPMSTLTLTSTSTPTQTPTTTPTSSVTSTPSNTATKTPTATNTNTPTNTPFITSTATNTAINTATRTPTNSPTLTPTSTASNTPAATATATSTQVTVSVASGPSIPLNSTQLPGTVNLPVIQVVLGNPSSVPVTITRVTLGNSGSVAGISGITLENNGTSLGTIPFTGSTAVFNGINVVIPAFGSVTLQANANFSAIAPVGPYLFSVQGATGTNGQTVNFNGLPYNGAIITLSIATATPTRTFTPAPTLTWTATPTMSPTSTRSFTPTPSDEVVLGGPYPNPSQGGPVNVDVQTTGPSSVRWSVFTLSFRKIVGGEVSVNGAGKIQWDLKDATGAPAANGLYYIRVEVNGPWNGTKVLKVLVIR